MIEPSKEAIETAFRHWCAAINEPDQIVEAIKAAYAIDFAQLQAECDQLRLALQEARDDSLKILEDHQSLREAFQESQQKLQTLTHNFDKVFAERSQQHAALQESQQRLADVNVKDSAKTKESNILVDENRKQQAIIEESQQRVKELESDLALAKPPYSPVSQARVDELVRVSWNQKQKLDQQQAIIQELAEALRSLSWTEQGCWCVDFAEKCLENVMRHDEDCQRARAALAAAGLEEKNVALQQRPSDELHERV